MSLKKKTVTEVKAEMNSKQLQQKLDADKKDRQEKCAQELKTICEKYECNIIPVITLRPDGLIPNIEIQAK